MKNKFLFLFFFLIGFFIFSNQSFAQNNEQDVIYLKNGSIIKGKVLSSPNDQKIRIEILGGSIFVFDRSEIEQFKVEPIPNIKKQFKGEIQYKERGFINISDMGFPIGSDRWGVVSGLSFKTVNGFQFNPNSYIALGIGLDFYFSNADVLTTTSFRYGGDILKNKPVTPIYYAEVGYGFPWKSYNTDWETHKGGELFQVGTGFKFYTRNATSVVWSIGYGYQKSTVIFQMDTRSNLQERVYIYNRINLRLGISF